MMTILEDRLVELFKTKRSDALVLLDSFRGNIPQELVNSSHEIIRVEIADRDTTPVEVLAELAYDSSEQVRTCVALNPNTTQELLEKAFQNELELIIKAVKKRDLSLSEAMVDSLMETQNRAWCETLIYEKLVTQAQLIKMIQDNLLSSYMRWTVVADPKATPELLQVMCESEFSGVLPGTSVLGAILNNKNTTPATLVFIYVNGDPTEKLAAFNVLRDEHLIEWKRLIVSLLTVEYPELNETLPAEWLTDLFKNSNEAKQMGLF